MNELKLILIFASLTYSSESTAQLVNNGQMISVEKGSLLYVDHNYVHNDGLFLNNGEVFIKNDWFNNHTGNKVFDIGSVGVVKFIGGAQRIAGTSVTQFPRLLIAGVGSINLKKDTEVRLSLDLGEREVFTEANVLSLLSTDPAQLFYKNGFINTTGGGVFSRRTAKNEIYHYPFGSSASSIFRPISIKPKDNQPNTFNASLVDKDASLDGYSRLSKRSEVTEVNDKYYFKLSQPIGLSIADFSFFTVQKDGDYNGMVNWAENRIWQKAASVKVKDGFSQVSKYDRVLTYTSTGSIGTELTPYNLAKVSNANNPLAIFNAFSPDGDGKNDTWEIKNIEAFPDNEIKVYDRSGNMIYRMENYAKSKAWDGQNAKPGTYFYIVRVKISGEDKYYKGAITLVRN